MKKVFLILPFLALFACGESDKLRIKGEIEDGKGKTIYLDKLEVAGPVLVDSLIIKSGNRFSFTSRISDPSFFRIRFDDNNFITLLAEPGENIQIAASASNLPGTYEISGSEGSDLIKKLDDRLLMTKKQMEPLIREIRNMDAETFDSEEVRINVELEEILNSQRNFSIAFILENMESLAAITALYQYIDDQNYVLNKTRDIQYLKIVSESLNKKYPSSPHVRALVADAENQERQYELFRFSAMAEEKGQVVTTYPDIAMPGTDGDTISLHSIQERYILLLFGSSLNAESVRLSNDLLPVYNAYHKKGFNIYHVSVERDRQEWLKNLEFLELPWIHVAELGEGSFDAAHAYNVQQIPSNYLINREAGVVARNITAPDLRRRLSRALD
ncbi:MAG: DUF4369 domain-containing protein [Bacteroidales bacterium]